MFKNFGVKKKINKSVKWSFYASKRQGKIGAVLRLAFKIFKKKKPNIL